MYHTENKKNISNDFLLRPNFLLRPKFSLELSISSNFKFFEFHEDLDT